MKKEKKIIVAASDFERIFICFPEYKKTFPLKLFTYVPASCDFPPSVGEKKLNTVDIFSIDDFSTIQAWIARAMSSRLSDEPLPK